MAAPNPDRRRRASRSPSRDIVLVATAALLLRAVHWWLYSRTPFFAHPVVDASFFDIWARNLVAGREFQPDVFFKPPLYAYLLASFYRLFGATPSPVYFAQTALGVGSALLVLAIGRRVLPARTALVGALIAAVLPILPFFELQLLAETVTTFLSLLALLWLLAARGADGGWSARHLIGAGLVLGVAAVGRPNLLLLAPLFAWWLLRGGAAATADARRGVATGDARRGIVGGVSGWRPAALFLLAVGLALLPTTLRNARVGGVFVPVSANFGANLWTGVMPGQDGTAAVPVGLHWDDLQLRCREAGAGTAADASGHLTAEALRSLAAQPGRALGLLGRKLLILVSAQEPRNNIGAAFLAREMGVVTLSRWWPGFWLAGPFMLLGLLGARRWGRSGLLLLLYLGGLVVSILPFFVNDRFRAPLLPIGALFAGAAVIDLVERWRAGGWRRLLGPLAVLAFLFVLVNVDWLGQSDVRRQGRDHFELGMIQANEAMQGGRPDAAALAAAEQSFRRAMQLEAEAPDYPERYGQMLLGVAQPLLTRAEDLVTRGDLAGAVSLYEQTMPIVARALDLHRRAARLFPRSFLSHANIGNCLLWQADAAALGARRVDRPGAVTGVGQAREQARRRYDEAEAAYRESLRIKPEQRTIVQNLQLLASRRRAVADSAPPVP